MTVIGAVRHAYARRPGDRHEGGVRLEGPPRVEHLIAGTGGGKNELGQQGHRTGADVHLVDVDTILGGEAFAQGERRGIRVAVVRRFGCDRGDDAGQRVEWVLIAGEFEGTGVSRFSLLIGREGDDLRTQADGGSV